MMVHIVLGHSLSGAFVVGLACRTLSARSAVAAATHCPRCGATLSHEDEVLCPGCGFARGASTLSIEVSPDELIADVHRARSAGPGGDQEGEEDSLVMTTPSGLLDTATGSHAVVAAERAVETRTQLVAVSSVVLALILAIAVLAVLLFGG